MSRPDQEGKHMRIGAVRVSVLLEAPPPSGSHRAQVRRLQDACRRKRAAIRRLEECRRFERESAELLIAALEDIASGGDYPQCAAGDALRAHAKRLGPRP